MFKSLHRLHNLFPFKRTLSTSPVSQLCIKFENHDDFVKKVFVENDMPVIINFHADWYEPCQDVKNTLKSKIESLEEMALAVVNVEDHMDLVHTFNIKAVPAVLGVKNGLVVQKITGNVQSKDISDLMKQLSDIKEQ